MWLDRAQSLLSTQHPFAFVHADESWGTHFIIAELVAGVEPVLWIQLNAGDSDIELANKLSDAIHRSFGTRLFGYGLPSRYCWRRMLEARETLGKFQIAVSGTAPNRIDLGFMYSGPLRMLLFGDSFSTPDFLVDKALTLSGTDLRMSREEAEEIARDRVKSKREIEVLYDSSDGRYERFMSALQRHLGLPPLARPVPDGYTPVGGTQISPDPLIESHLRRGYWIEAFEVAVRHCVDRVPDLLENAAEQYLDRGLMDRLFERLSALPSELRSVEVVAYWLVASAISTNNHRIVIPSLRTTVDVSKMPDVRALLAVQELTRDSLDETLAAFESRQSVVTTRLHAFCLTQFGRPKEALELLMTALDEAQARAKGRDQITIASTIAHATALTGDYTASLSWAEWALQGFEKFKVNDEIEKLYIKSQVQYMSILAGDVSNLPLIPRDFDHQHLAGIPTIEAVISTAGDFEFVFGDLDIALAYYRMNQRYQSRDQAGHFGLDVCRTLLAKGDVTAAIDTSERAVALAENTNQLNILKARLANAISAAASPNYDRDTRLEECLGIATQLKHWDVAAIAGLSLASSHIKFGRVQRAGDVLRRCEAGLTHLGDSGWQLFGRWIDNLAEVREMYETSRNPVQLHLLNNALLRRNGEEFKLSLRNAEILAVLALHPEGLSGEQLADKLYSVEVSSSTLKAALSKLRNHVAIRSQPYAISEFLTTDFGRVEQLIVDGDTVQALFEYKGPMLRESESPGVVAYRDYLDEAVRQAALHTEDADALFEYAQTRSGDLELWEHLMKLTSTSDPRKSFVHARVLRIKEEWGLNEA